MLVKVTLATAMVVTMIQNHGAGVTALARVMQIEMDVA